MVEVTQEMVTAALRAVDDLHKARLAEQKWEPANEVPCPTEIEEMQAAIEAALTTYLAALEAEGFVVVPVCPTETMLEAGHLRDPLGCDIEPNDAPMIYERIWEAMLAARPQVKENGNG